MAPKHVQLPRAPTGDLWRGAGEKGIWLEGLTHLKVSTAKGSTVVQTGASKTSQVNEQSQSCSFKLVSPRETEIWTAIVAAKR